MKKKLLFVGSGGNSKSYTLRTARDLGFEVIVAQKNRLNPAALADFVLKIDITRLDELIINVVEFNLHCQVDGVVTFFAGGVLPSSILCNLLKLPGLCIGAANRCRNKYLTRVSQKKNGIPHPDFRLARDINHLKQISTEMKFPLIIKPLNFTASSCVQKINNVSEVITISKKCKKQRGNSILHHYMCDTLSKYWLIEEFLDGIEVVVESITYEGETTIIAIFEKIGESDNPPFAGKIYVTPPFRISKKMKQEIVLQTKANLKAIGFDFGLSDADFRLTSEGPRLLEINARIGGHLLGPAVYLSTGVNMVRCLLEMSVGGKPNFKIQSRRPTAIGIIYASKGIVKSVCGYEEALKVPNVHTVEQWIKRGDVVKEPHVQHAGAALVTGNKLSDVIHNTRTACACVRYRSWPAF